MSETQQVEETITQTPQEQVDHAVKIARAQQKALDALIDADIKNYMYMLVRSGVNENDKVQIINSFTRSILFAMDFGVGATDRNLNQKGKLAKLENSMAAHLVRLKENGMLIMADNLQKQELKENNKTGENIENEIK